MSILYLIVIALSVYPIIVGSVFWRNSITHSLRGRHYNLSPWLLSNIAGGGQLAMDHCQHQFQWERWNCPRRDFFRWNSKPTEAPTKEMAYLDAIIAAAIVHTIARNCSSGLSCPGLRIRRKADNKVWSRQQNDQIDYGEYIVQSFLENSPPAVDLTSYARQHNTVLGRKAVRNSSIKKCMCHGISGTCSLKTCWTSAAPFGVVATQLKKKYDRAVRLDFEGVRGMKIGNSVTSPLFKAPTGINKQEQLIFLQKSPDYCKPNISTGWPGTKGRTCKRSADKGKKSCRDLCRKCGHNVRRKRKSDKLCNCKFTWCCKVTCDTCKDTENEYYCA